VASSSDMMMSCNTAPAGVDRANTNRNPYCFRVESTGTIPYSFLLQKFVLSASA